MSNESWEWCQIPLYCPKQPEPGFAAFVANSAGGDEWLAEAKRNARLATAAPALLAACEGMIELCKTLLLKDCGFYSPENNGYIQSARAAIAKAVQPCL